MSLDAQELAEVFRIGIARSGSLTATPIMEAKLLPLAMALTEYLKTHLEVVLPQNTLVINEEAINNPAIKCKVS